MRVPVFLEKKMSYNLHLLLLLSNGPEYISSSEIVTLNGFLVASIAEYFSETLR
jgi:hypothetical protein